MRVRDHAPAGAAALLSRPEPGAPGAPIRPAADVTRTGEDHGGG